MKNGNRGKIPVGVQVSVALCMFLLVSVMADEVQTTETGRNQYEEYCAACHGYDGIPFLPDVPNFSKGESLDQGDAKLLKSITEGKGDIMPPWQDTLNEEERAEILRYVRSIAGATGSEEN